MKRTIEFQKQCECSGSSTTGRLVEREAKRDNENMHMSYIFYPAPVCDVCDMPWEEVDSDN